MKAPIQKLYISELFSGLGSQVKALRIAAKNCDYEIVSSATCEWDIHAIIAYYLLHGGSFENNQFREMSEEEILKKLNEFTLSYNGKEPIKAHSLKGLGKEVLRKLLIAITANKNIVDITKAKEADIPDETNILTYSFPCQDLSNAGSLHGYNKGIDRDADNRSGLLWQVERILNEKKAAKKQPPRFLLLENVKTLECKRHADNFQSWKNSLSDLGYLNYSFTLKAFDLGVPQGRERLFMLSVYIGDNKLVEEEVRSFFSSSDVKSIIISYVISNKKKTLESLLREDYEMPDILEEAISACPNNTKSRKKIYKENLVLRDKERNYAEFCNTITTRQDRHPNSGNIYFTKAFENNNAKAQYRFLTPRECFLLMGFSEIDFLNIKKGNFIKKNNKMFFTRDKYYKLAGNSIVVDMLVPIFSTILELNTKINALSSKTTLTRKTSSFSLK